MGLEPRQTHPARWLTRRGLLFGMVTLLGGCTRQIQVRSTPITDANGQPVPTPAPTPTATTAPPDLAVPPTTGPATTLPPGQSTLPSATAPPPAAIDDQIIEVRTIGQSVEGRPIIAERRGTRGGRVVLVVGVIHGDEQAGMQVLKWIRDKQVPDGVDLWLIDQINPDGYLADTRQNANQVDLNRNFPFNWAPLGEPGFWQYSGPSEASEPETRIMMEFLLDIDPEITLWYHQDYYRISPSTGADKHVRERYAELTGLPLLPISGGTYTGSAATWARHNVTSGIAFIIELGPTLSETEAEIHADAVLTIASE